MNTDTTPHRTWAQLVAAELRAEMARQRRTGVDLAQHLGMAQPTISKRLNGETLFDLGEIERIAEWLGIHPSDLLARADERAVPA